MRYRWRRLGTAVISPDSIYASDAERVRDVPQVHVRVVPTGHLLNAELPDEVSNIIIDFQR